MKKFIQRHETYVFLIIVLFSIIISSVNPNFLTLENAFDLLKSHAFTGILAIGVLMVLISGGIDISFAATATIAEYVTVIICISLGGSMFTAFLLAVLIGIILGSVNGILIHHFKISPIITTIATMNIYYGLLIVFTKGKWIYALPDFFRSFAEVRVLTLMNADGMPYGVSIITVIWIVLMLIASFLLNFTKLGRGIYAIGGDIVSADRVGFNVGRIHIFIYACMGAMAAIAGIVQALQVQTVAPNSIVGKELSVIAAVVLGGASLAGGFGTVLGTFLGVMLLAIVQNGMTLMKISAVWYDVFVGLVIIISVGFSSYRRLKEARASKIDIDDLQTEEMGQSSSLQGKLE
ncbi:MAG: ABC transporter permease [Spirochaetia bacterium]|nr:ABC transporter permease [Spirochaetia bacterium]